LEHIAPEVISLLAATHNIKRIFQPARMAFNGHMTGYPEVNSFLLRFCFPKLAGTAGRVGAHGDGAGVEAGVAAGGGDWGRVELARSGLREEITRRRWNFSYALWRLADTHLK
jgi:hypothetical protein